MDLSRARWRVPGAPEGGVIASCAVRCARCGRTGFRRGFVGHLDLVAGLDGGRSVDLAELVDAVDGQREVGKDRRGVEKLRAR